VAAWPGTDVRVGGPSPAGHDIVANAAALGMRAGDALPLDPATLPPGTIVAEIVVAPETTASLAEAARRGYTLHYGKPMLAAQIDLMIAFMVP
jgi:shikimate 5-dehydrogenase